MNKLDQINQIKPQPSHRATAEGRAYAFGVKSDDDSCGWTWIPLRIWLILGLLGQILGLGVRAEVKFLAGL